MLKITEVKVFPVKETGRLKAYATITFEGAFKVCDLKIIQGNKGVFVAMPSRRRKDGTFKDVAHPTISELRRAIEESVIKEFDNLTGTSFTSDL